MAGDVDPKGLWRLITGQNDMSIAPRENIIKNCFAWCGRHVCECSSNAYENIIPNLNEHKETQTQALEIESSEDSQMKMISYVKSLDIFSRSDLRMLLAIAQNNKDNLIRNLAKAKIECRAMIILEKLLYNESI